jgi:hypothetical protein
MKKFSLVLLTLLTMSWIPTCFAQSTEEDPRDPNAPANTIKIPGRDIYVSGMDEPSRMSWDVANSACNCRGKGWRLPTIGELQTIYQYKDLFGNFSREYYWALEMNVRSGRYYNLKFTNGKIADEEVKERNKVRCVWVPARVD